MKLCRDCNVYMTENTELHTDYVGGVSFEEQIFLTFGHGEARSKSLLGFVIGHDNQITRRVKARVCPSCGKVELFVDLNSEEDE